MIFTIVIRYENFIKSIIYERSVSKFSESHRNRDVQPNALLGKCR